MRTGPRPWTRGEDARLLIMHGAFMSRRQIVSEMAYMGREPGDTLRRLAYLTRDDAPEPGLCFAAPIHG